MMLITNFLLSNHHGFGFNTNILETNLINIILLVALIVYVAKNALLNSIDLRREQIIKALNTLDDNVVESQLMFIRSNKQLQQINLILSNLQEENTTNKLNSLKRKHQHFILVVDNLCNSSIQTIERNFNEGLKSIERYLFYFAIGKVLTKFVKLTPKERQKILENVIMSFGGEK
jgi:F-type H+-transporting ATPase subunit b